VVRLRWLARGTAGGGAPAGRRVLGLGACPHPARVAGSVAGILRAVSFDHGQVGDPRDAGRRGLSEALGSLTPNTIVIGIDPDRDLVLVHQLRRSGGADGVDVLGLG